MQIYEYKEVTRNEKTLIKTTCDVCKNEIKTGRFEVDDVVMCHTHGSCYPEGRNVEVLEYDICGNCFSTKIVPFMQTLGATNEPKEENF